MEFFLSFKGLKNNNKDQKLLDDYVQAKESVDTIFKRKNSVSVNNKLKAERMLRKL